MVQTSDFRQGGDAQAISRIATEVYGGFRQMFDAHGWDAPGNKLMTAAPALIVNQYGSIRGFEAAHQKPSRFEGYSASDVWDRGYSVLFTSFWGWSPETWGTVGWSGDRGLTRRSNLLAQLTDPFITVCYVTSNKTYIDPALKGKIAGFYLVSHETGDRDEFTHPIHHGRDVEKWRHSLRALRAFGYLPEHRLKVTDLDPGLLARARSVSAMGEVITDPAQIKLLRDTPWMEVEVYTPASASAVDAVPWPEQTQGMVQAGPASSDGYVVAGGTQWTPRELYILKLDGNIDAYLGRSASGRVIVKVGLAASPDIRRQSFQKAMPRGAFQWKIDRTLSGCGLALCPNHGVAVRGEDAMKRHLAAHAEWLGGEFYLASGEVIEAAWQLACNAAKSSLERGNNEQ
ncbi:MAG: hypothetical protein APF80_14245 [Alphaproteobacteria bacterium BRH_c36]|nr:MAG: hypothetical protein APF80_14245 [Alphaproteobacteria bacterium BRH_c36]